MMIFELLQVPLKDTLEKQILETKLKIFYFFALHQE